jgi:hypothetical protein
VYNQALLKAEDASMHASNAMLYSVGVVINVILHIVIGLLNDDEPGFFVGFGSVGAVLVILSNVFIGLAITAVYKCKFLTPNIQNVVLISCRCGCYHQMSSDGCFNWNSVVYFSYIFRDGSKLFGASWNSRGDGIFMALYGRWFAKTISTTEGS